MWVSIFNHLPFTFGYNILVSVFLSQDTSNAAQGNLFSGPVHVLDRHIDEKHATLLAAERKPAKCSYLLLLEGTLALHLHHAVICGALALALQPATTAKTHLVLGRGWDGRSWLPIRKHFVLACHLQDVFAAWGVCPVWWTELRNGALWMFRGCSDGITSVAVEQLFCNILSTLRWLRGTMCKTCWIVLAINGCNLFCCFVLNSEVQGISQLTIFH